jgi:hypothetical protein
MESESEKDSLKESAKGPEPYVQELENERRERYLVHQAGHS